MSLTLKIPLWDGEESENLIGQRTFETIDEEMALPLISEAVDDLVPDMTSATTPSPFDVTQYSSEFSSTYVPWKLFDKNRSSNSRWIAANGTTSGWFILDCGVAGLKISRYSISQ